MNDVAEVAGVSLKTVSRVVNEESGVSESLARRVRAAVAKLGYRRDNRATQLRRSNSSTSTIGFVLVDVANPFFGSILRGIEDVATQRGSLVLAASTDGSRQRHHEVINTFVERRVDGLIVVPAEEDPGPVETEMRRGTPVVFLDLEPGIDGIDMVRSDHYQGAVAATRHLLAHGHTEIAFFGDDLSFHSARLRKQGFVDAMAQAGVTVPPSRVITGALNDDEWYERARSTMQTSRPTAVFTAQNFVSIGTVRALHSLGLQHQVAQVGFDDVELADVVSPGISVVPQDPRSLGRRAAELLFDRIEGDEGPPRRIIEAASVIARGSGEIWPT